MTASEFTFLALGLVLGVAAGAAVIEVLRARPPATRYVRVTVIEEPSHVGGHRPWPIHSGSAVPHPSLPRRPPGVGRPTVERMIEWTRAAENVERPFVLARRRPLPGW